MVNSTYLWTCVCPFIKKYCLQYSVPSNKYTAKAKRKYFLERAGKLGPWDSE